MKLGEVYVCKVRRHDPSGVRERKWEVDKVIFHCIHEWNSLRRMNEWMNHMLYQISKKYNCPKLKMAVLWGDTVCLIREKERRWEERENHSKRQIDRARGIPDISVYIQCKSC